VPAGAFYLAGHRPIADERCRGRNADGHYERIAATMSPPQIDEF
jgi:hypothetical protein